MPIQPAATAAPAPGNIWAIGPDTPSHASPWALAHWTGRWKVVALPDPPPGEQIFSGGVDWDNAHGAWVVASLIPKGSGNQYGGLLLHWTGSRWVNIPYPYQTFGLGPFAHDGHGGFWIASQSCFAGSCTDMVHYSPARGWSRPVSIGPFFIRAMRLIPRTGSVWAGGTRWLAAIEKESAVILKYGP